MTRARGRGEGAAPTFCSECGLYNGAHSWGCSQSADDRPRPGSSEGGRFVDLAHSKNHVGQDQWLAAVEDDAPFYGETPGLVLALATVAWAASRKEARP